FSRDWSSDVCSSDLGRGTAPRAETVARVPARERERRGRQARVARRQLPPDVADADARRRALRVVERATAVTGLLVTAAQVGDVAPALGVAAEVDRLGAGRDGVVERDAALVALDPAAAHP